MNSKVYKWCAVPLCKNTSLKTPNKLFIYVPNKKIMRDKWFKLARRNPTSVKTNSPIYFCEDHFDLPNDMENFMQYHVMGFVAQVRMKPGCLPKKFACQPDRKTRTGDTDTIERPYISKKRKMMILEECDALGKSTSTATVTEKHNFEEIASGSTVLKELLQSTPNNVPSAFVTDVKQEENNVAEIPSTTGYVKGSGITNFLPLIEDVKTKFVDIKEILNSQNITDQESEFKIGKVKEEPCGVKCEETGNEILFDDPYLIKSEDVDIKDEDDQYRISSNGSDQHEGSPSNIYDQKTREEERHFEYKKGLDDEVFKCNECDFQTDRKSSLKVHVLEHKNRSNVKVHKCNNCDYQTIYKNCLKRHFLKHENPEAIEKFKCDSCSYETFVKNDLNRHQLTHKNLDEIGDEVYKCNECDFKTKYNNSLKAHRLLQHEDRDHVEVFKCNNCEFETVYRSSFKVHLRKYEDPKEVKKFKCNFCDYRSSRKSTISKHQFKHRNIDNIEVYKCGKCDFQSAHKNSFNQHLLIHKNPNDIKIFKCDFCKYQTFRKSDFNKHQFIHKNPDEVAKFKCDRCEYKTFRKASIKEHLLTHENPEEAKKLKCEFCSYKTFRERTLRTHRLIHVPRQ